MVAHRGVVWGIGIVLAGALANAGCSSPTGVERAETVSRGSADVKGEVNRMMASLKGLQDVAEKGLDLKAQFAQFKAELTDLEAVAERLKARGDDLKANRDAYLQAWESELASVGSELVQSTSTARREAVAAAFADVESQSKDARANYTLFMKDISAIRIALENDLTAQGVKAVAPLVQKTEGEGRAVSKGADAVAASLDRLAKQMPAQK
jgi:vacuolar-type H+-ATPase subunit I/STV1